MTEPKLRGRGFAEHQRDALLRRLSYLGESKKKLPGYRTALRLLNKRYVLSNAKARLNILKAASFMVFVLERTPL